MDNRFTPIVEAISERMAPLGLHQVGPASMNARIHDHDHEYDEDSEDGLDDEFGMDVDVADRLKNSDADAMIHMTFSIKKLAWEDRTLYPETISVDDDFDDLVGDDGQELLAKEIARRLEAGESLVDMLDLFSKNDKDED